MLWFAGCGGRINVALNGAADPVTPFKTTAFSFINILSSACHLGASCFDHFGTAYSLMGIGNMYNFSKLCL